MKKKTLKKPQIFIIFVAAFVIGLLYVLISSGIIKFETFGSDEQTIKVAYTVEELEDGCFYIWHNENGTDINESLKDGKNVFRKCPTGDVNWLENEHVNHILWFTSSNDIEIPTLYPGDELIYVSSTYVPYEGIEWEHFADYGYSIGVANLQRDNGGHYRIINNGEGDYSGYIYENSDVIELEQYVNVESIFLDKIGSTRVTDELVTEDGTIYGLKKDKSYICEWYTGTYYQDYEMRANIHVFGSLETFTTYDYEFLHSRCISITIPDWFTTGYYYVDEIGLFRYVTGKDADNYNGEPYDPSINWNEKIIIKDENGMIKYDPTTGYTNEFSDNKTTPIQNDVGDKSNLEQLEENEDDMTDVGAAEYEDITDEIIMP